MLPPRHPEALLVLLVLALGAWLAYRVARIDRAWPYVGVLLSAGTVPLTGGARSALLPYLLAPGLSLGLTGGVPQLVLASVASGLALTLATWLPHAETGMDYGTAGAQWILLSLALGLVAIWARRFTSLAGTPGNQYVEIRQLLEQLRSATRHLPGGLDAPSVAEVVLDRCAALTKSSRSAVLVQPTPGALVPLAVRGTHRVPWRNPNDAGGPLHRAWVSGKAVVDIRNPDKAGRRVGSALVVVPLVSDGTTFGLVVLESPQLDLFDKVALASLTEVVNEAALRLETALLFEEVRLAASVQERDRLAREMHDGIAQELAFLGYRLDDLRGRAAKVDSALGEHVAEIRGGLTGLISDLRLSITDLRTTVSPDRGLGAALSTYLRAVCSGKDIVLNLSLQETAFRLPAEQEVMLFNAAQAFSQEVRRSADVHELSVTLVVEPPSARLIMTCDGPARLVELGEVGLSLARLGAVVTTSGDRPGGQRLEIELLGGMDDDQRGAGGRPRTDSARPAAGVRAD